MHAAWRSQKLFFSWALSEGGEHSIPLLIRNTFGTGSWDHVFDIGLGNSLAVGRETPQPRKTFSLDRFPEIRLKFRFYIFLSYVSYVSLSFYTSCLLFCNNIITNLVAQKDTALWGHSFCGSGVWKQLSWVLCSQSNDAAIQGVGWAAFSFWGSSGDDSVSELGGCWQHSHSWHAADVGSWFLVVVGCRLFSASCHMGLSIVVAHNMAAGSSKAARKWVSY